MLSYGITTDHRIKAQSRVAVQKLMMSLKGSDSIKQVIPELNRAGYCSREQLYREDTKGA